jgi:transposase
MAFVLGHARYLKAIHGGNAKNDTIDAQNIAVLRRGGMWPQAAVYPAAMRATRALLRRRMHLRRTRAEWLGHSQQTPRQDHLPAMGKKIAYKANRDGVAERVAEPAVQKRLAGDLALRGHYDPRLRDRELASLKTAQPHAAHTPSRLRPVPGMGAILRLVLLAEIHAMQRFPRGQDLVAYWRLGTWAKDSAGQRYSTAGTKSGKASRKWAFSAAAGLCLRNHPQGQQYLARLEQQHGKGQALTGLAHTLARAVYHLLKRDRACALPHFLQSASGAERMSPVSNWPIAGRAWIASFVVLMALRRERCGAQRPSPLSPAR